MKSKRKREGYLLLDHSNGPGLTDAELAWLYPGLPPGAGYQRFETPTYTCSHCMSIVVLNPKRTRDRAYCSKCDAYICDACGVAYGLDKTCRSMRRALEEAQEQAALAEQRGSIILLT